MFSQYFAVVSPLLLHDLFAQLQWCIQQDNEQLARSGISCLENLVLSNGSKFNAESWDNLCQCLHDVCSSTTPSQLQSWRPAVRLGRQSAGPDLEIGQGAGEVDIGFPPPRHHSHRPGLQETGLQQSAATQQKLFSVLSVKCIVQLELIHSIDSIVFYPAASRREDAELVARAQNNNLVIKAEREKEERGMYSHLSLHHLSTLLDCLLQAHRLASIAQQPSFHRSIQYQYTHQCNFNPLP